MQHRHTSLVKVQHLDTVAQCSLDLLGVVAEAVIGGIGDHRQLDARLAPPRQRMRVDLGAYRLGAELAQRNGADDAEFVALRCQVQRNRAGHDDGVQDGLVAVAIDQYQVVATDHGVPDDLVGRGGAVDNEEAVVGTEIARRPRLRLGHRPGVIQQRAQFRHGYRKIRTQRVLAEELVESLADRALAVATPPPWPGVCQE